MSREKKEKKTVENKLVSRFNENDKAEIYAEIKQVLLKNKIITKETIIDKNFEFDQYESKIWNLIRPIMEKHAKRFSKESSRLTPGDVLGELLPLVFKQVFPNLKIKDTKLNEEDAKKLNKTYEGFSGFIKKGKETIVEVVQDVKNDLEETVDILNKGLDEIVEHVETSVYQNFPGLTDLVRKGLISIGNEDKRIAPVLDYIGKVYTEFKANGYDVTKSYDEQPDKEKAAKLQEAGEAASIMIGSLIANISRLKNSEKNKDNSFSENQFYWGCYTTVMWEAPPMLSDSQNTGMMNNLLAYTNAIIELLAYCLSIPPNDVRYLSLPTERKDTADRVSGTIIKSDVQGLSSATKEFKGKLFDQHTSYANKQDNDEDKDMKFKK